MKLHGTLVLVAIVALLASALAQTLLDLNFSQIHVNVVVVTR